MFCIRLMILFLMNLNILCAREVTTTSSSQKSWIESANKPSSDFPLQNLPYGIFNLRNKSFDPRICIAIGDYVLDLKGCVDAGLLNEIPNQTCLTLQKEVLNDFMSLDRTQHLLVRLKIIELLKEDSPAIRNNMILKNNLLHLRSGIDLLMPIQIGDYTDFYASIHHASHVGSIMRPDNPLMPNYRHMPIGYHGRSSSIVVSGNPIFRPFGQILNGDGFSILSLSNL